MKDSVTVEIEIDLESIVEDSKKKDDALQMLNYRLKKTKQQSKEKFENKYDDLQVEFEEKLDKIWKE